MWKMSVQVGLVPVDSLKVEIPKANVEAELPISVSPQTFEILSEN